MDMVELIDDGDQFFEKLWDVIDNAKVCCWILTYHIGNDLVANKTLKKLANAAERGVNVVLMVDWLNYWPNYALIKELENKGGTVRAVNPMGPWKRYIGGQEIFSREVFERYHEKVFVIDDLMIIGSANLDSDYAGPKYGNSNFYDLNIIFKKKCIEEAQTAFDILSTRYDWYLKIPKIEEFPDENYEILVSEPYYMRWEIQERILDMIRNAKSKITLVQGYYYNVPKVTKALKQAIDRGVEVDLLTSKKRDQPVYKLFLNSWLTKHLKDIGVNVYEFNDQVLHMKAYICDDREFTIGSFNNDIWSWQINNELNLYVNDKMLTKRLIDIADKVKSRSNPVQFRIHTFKEMFYIRFWEVFYFLSMKAMDTASEYKLYFEQAFINDNKPLSAKLEKKREKVKRNMHNYFSLIKFDLYG